MATKGNNGNHVLDGLPLKDIRTWALILAFGGLTNAGPIAMMNSILEGKPSVQSSIDEKPKTCNVKYAEWLDVGEELQEECGHKINTKNWCEDQ